MRQFLAPLLLTPALLLGLALLALPDLSLAAPSLSGCPVFPADNVWNARISSLPAHPDSDDWLASISESARVHADFGSGEWPPDSGALIGIPITVVGPDQPCVPVSFTWPDESDAGPYPIPADAAIEGGPDASGDRHVLVLDPAAGLLYELYNAWPPTSQSDDTWEADAGAVFDLHANDLRPDGWTSADAAGLAILPGLARYDEVAAGRIEHALRCTLVHTRKGHVWPARHHASSITDPGVPPMGARLRLRADADLSELGPQALVLARAMQEYGLILSDNGSDLYVSGAPDEGWDNDDLHTLHTLHREDFEWVDASPLQLDPDSAAARRLSCASLAAVLAALLP